jgi:hypothetical protein
MKIVPDLISQKPVPFWFVHVPRAGDLFMNTNEALDLLIRIDSALLPCAFRGVSINRLKSILPDGIDVEPTDSVIFTNDLDKAWEYGGWPKLVLALDTSRLQRTFKQVPSDISPSELERIRQHYPTVVKSLDGTQLWLTRLEESDPRIASPYEIAHARWIEGNPFDALRAILLCVRPEDDPEILSLVKSLR